MQSDYKQIEGGTQNNLLALVVSHNILHNFFSVFAYPQLSCLLL